MNLKILTILILVALPLYDVKVKAAGWEPNGHPELTSDVSTSSKFDLPQDIAKVIALGSIAPDYFEFENPAAHSQTPDPPIGKDGHLQVSEHTYGEMQKEARDRSGDWHAFYLDQSIQAMRRGNREQAAFLLGYALHNTEDLATHGGMTNLEHAALDGLGKSPDQDPKRLAVAHSLASSDIETFRQYVGETNWQLFRGEAVRGAGQSTIIPEPLTRFGSDLATWDPRSGVIPPSSPAGQAFHEANSLFQSLVDLAFYKLIGDPRRGFYKPDTLGKFDDKFKAELRIKINTVLAALYSRQEKMRQLLSLNIERDTDSPKLPDLLDVDGLLNLAISAYSFHRNSEWFLDSIPCLPCRYSRFSLSEMNLLKGTIWATLLKKRLEEAKEYRRMVRELAKSLPKAGKKKWEEIRKFEAKQARLANLSMPSRDANPPPHDSADSSEGYANRRSPQNAGSSGSGSYGGSSSIPSINLDKYRNPNFDGFGR